jgi:hypothetical protein
VSNHYGARDQAGAEGVFRTAGANVEIVLDGKGDKPLHDEIIVPVGAEFVGYDELNGASGYALSVGATSVITASAGTPIPASGLVALSSGNGQGKIVAVYKYVA